MTDPNLNRFEKLLLLALAEMDGATPASILKAGKLRDRAHIMNAASWLDAKQMVEVRPRVHLEYKLKTRKYSDRPLPERRLLRALEKHDGRLRVRQAGELAKLDKSETGIGLGWIKKNGWATIDQGELVLTTAGEQAFGKENKDERMLHRLAEGSVIADETNRLVLRRLLGRKDLIAEREVVSRTLHLQEAGREAIAAGIEIKEELNQLTSKLIQTGKWREYDIRPYDVERFAPETWGGKLHPLTHLIREIKGIFWDLGFNEVEEDYVQSAFWNMDALFTAQDHPVREMQDTFYLDHPVSADLSGEKWVDTIRAVHENGGATGSLGWGGTWSQEEAAKMMLRTHTTVNTIRYLSEHPEPPAKIFSVGRVFRKEVIDSTHLPEFHQVEGIIVEEGGNLPMLMGTLQEFMRRLGFADVRVRPAYFPYTEPSLEFDVRHADRWMELGGAGIFRPEVTEPFGVRVPVLAWGFGLERLAMVRFGLDDIRQIYFSDLDWLRKAPVG